MSTPVKEHPEGSQSWLEWTQQLQAYVAWVNSQLKKKPGSRFVEDLRQDMKDGVALVILIEIVAGEVLPGVHLAPSNSHEMRENIERVLQFMAAKRIKMHHTTAKDIVEGNIKSIMRLILALAAHFKPSSVKQSSHHRSPRASPSMAAMAQGAAAALADSRREMASVGQKIRRPKELRDAQRVYQGSSSDHHSDSDQGGHVGSARERLSQSHRHRGEVDGASANSSPRSSVSLSRELFPSMTKSRSQDFDIGQSPRVRELVPAAGDMRAEMALRELDVEHQELKEDMETTKKTLLRLQDLLLNGESPDGAEDDDPSESVLEGSTQNEQIIVLNSRLQQTTELCTDLREELSKAKNDCMQLQGTKAGLQQRMTEQENNLLQMKAELLRLGFTKESLEAEKNEFQKKVTERDRIISEMKAEADLQMQEKENTARTLRSRLQEMNDRLRIAGENESSISSRMASQDRKMAKLEGKILQAHMDTSSQHMSAKSSQNGEDDLQMVRDSLVSLRSAFQGEEGQQHNTIDTLEQSIAALMDRLRLAEQKVAFDSRRINYDSTGDPRRSPIVDRQGFPVHRLDRTLNGQPSTKVLYFTDRTVTPFMCTIPKRLGEISLKDFKDFFDRPGNFRYHFKALDPEFGTVKEEVTNEEDVIPGWEGKIVAWIEEDHG